MKKAALMMTTCLLAACAGSETPAPSVAYVPAAMVDPSSPAALIPAVPITVENPVPTPKQVKYKSHEAKTAAAVKAASQNALDASFEGIILNYEYQHGRQYKVVVDGPSSDWEQDGDVTTITLGPDEAQVPDIAQGGDPNWFLVENISSGIDDTSMRARKASELTASDVARARTVARDGGVQTLLTVKCFKRGERGSLVVGTGKRKYRFALYCANSHGGRGYNPDVQFTYLFDRQVSQKPTPTTSKRPVAPIVADTRYTVDGPAEWRPREWAAWNDGANTHIRPSPVVQSRPVPLLPPGGGFYVDANTSEYVITGLPSEIRFPWGDTAVTVRRAP